jgi:hypothetical protein
MADVGRKEKKELKEGKVAERPGYATGLASGPCSRDDEVQNEETRDCCAAYSVIVEPAQSRRMPPITEIDKVYLKQNIVNTACLHSKFENYRRI